MPQQASFLGLAKRWAAAQLANATEIMQERCAEEKIGAEARVELRGFF